MSKYIKEHSLSVGYNNSGQEFFDILKTYEDYIHSYFFSLTNTMDGFVLDPVSIVDTLSNVETYGMNGNLLLNTHISEINYKTLILMCMDTVNLTSVTVLTPELARVIKEKYPELEVHLSVRYWDWNGDKSCIELLNDNIDLISEYIDVINISGCRSYNDKHLVDTIRSLGIKTKFIINESCIINRNYNYNKFPGFESESCFRAPCTRVCKDLVKSYPWMALSRTGMYKEFVQFFEYDILKLSSRNLDNETISNALDYWTSDSKTKMIYNDIGVSKHYDVYIEYIKLRSTCNGDCYLCQKCKDIYNRLIE